jgi:hypothetical protein
MQNRAPNIQNAVAVAFYEHLIDSPETKRDIPSYLKPRIFEDVRLLFERRMSNEEYQDLLTQYNKANGTHFS